MAEQRAILSTLSAEIEIECQAVLGCLLVTVYDMWILAITGIAMVDTWPMNVQSIVRRRHTSSDRTVTPCATKESIAESE